MRLLKSAWFHLFASVAARSIAAQVIYVTAVEPMTYFLAIVFPEARVQLANGTSIFFLRYAGWLCVS